MCLWKIQKNPLQRIICDRCGVEVTEKKVRRDRVGHINLGANCSYLVFPFSSKQIGYILGLPSKKLDMIIYYRRYVVIQAGIAKMKVNQYKD
jgi:DNA-directed RNA polymerase subunit beta'